MPSRGYTDPGTRRTSVYDPTLSSNYANNLWRDCPLQEYTHDPSIGIYLNESFNSYDAAATTGDWVLTQATAGTAAISTAAPGVLELDSGSSTTQQGANLQRVKSIFLPAAGKDIWFEVSLKIVDTFDKVELFAGLSDVETAIIASSANASDNHIGWQCVTDDGVLLFSGEKAGAGATRAATTIAEDTYVKLGFKVNGVTSIQQYINGVETGTATATANIPIVALVPSFVCQSAGTNDPIMHIHSLRVFQLR
jgi:hypothetical protein